MAKKITAAQLAVLREAKAGTLYRSESIGTLYASFNAARKNVSRQVAAVNAREPRLLQIGESTGRRRPWLLTEDGERVLAEHDTTTKEQA